MITCRTKQWGNSLGIIIPSHLVKELNIKPNEEIAIDIEKKDNVLKELFGALNFNKPTEKIIKETREDLDSKR